MNIAQTLDQAADSLERVNWKQVTKELIELWDLIWKILILSIIFTHLAGKSLGNWVHSTNDRLAANWVRLIVVPPTPAEVEQTPITVVAEEVSVPTPTTIVEVELKLPPPLVIEDPWASPIKVELMPPPLVSQEILFTTPMMLTAAQAPVALLAESQEVTQPPAPTKRRRSSAPRSPGKTMTEKVEPAPPSLKPRGRRAHEKCNRTAA